MTFPRLHKSTIVVAIIAVLLLVITGVPGRVVMWQPYDYSTFEHGCPFVYLRRQARLEAITFGDPIIFVFRKEALTTFLPMYGIPWLSTDNWKLWEADPNDGEPLRQFNPWCLLADVAIAMIVLSAVVAVWEFRRRRRGSLFSFSLVDMFVAVAVVCTVLGWVAHEKYACARETPSAETIWGSDDCAFSPWDETCVAPSWMRSLCGESLMPAFTWRIYRGNVNARFVHNTEELRAATSAMPYVKHVKLTGLASGDHHFRLSMLRAIPQLEDLEFEDLPSFDNQDINDLAQLTRLRKIIFEEKEKIDPNALSRLQTALPGCKVVDYRDDW
jgi:hypothetical protein